MELVFIDIKLQFTYTFPSKKFAFGIINGFTSS